MTEPCTLDDVHHSLDLLLHCVHADNLIDGSNALLQYGSLMALRKLIESRGSLSDFNKTCWYLRDWVKGAPVRFLEEDPIARPPSPVPGVTSVLAIPNSTSLNSGSTLVKQVQAQHGMQFVNRKTSAELGQVVEATPTKGDGYGEIWNLVCRTPGDPALKSLSECIGALSVPGKVVVVRLPMFGKETEMGTWAEALERWSRQRQNIQFAATFIELCFDRESLPKAQALQKLLRERGVVLGGEF